MRVVSFLVPHLSMNITEEESAKLKDPSLEERWVVFRSEDYEGGRVCHRLCFEKKETAQAFLKWIVEPITKGLEDMTTWNEDGSVRSGCSTWMVMRLESIRDLPHLKENLGRRTNRSPDEFKFT